MAKECFYSEALNYLGFILVPIFNFSRVIHCLRFVKYHIFVITWFMRSPYFRRGNLMGYECSTKQSSSHFNALVCALGTRKPGIKMVYL